MKLSAVFVFFMTICSSTLAQDYEVPRTENDQPDLNGIWNFNDSTPFERPDRFGTREFLNAEELAARDQRLVTGQDRRDASEATVSERVMNVPTNDTGAYYLFCSYYDEPYPNDRTSLIIYPQDGKIPATQPGVITQLSPPGSNPCNYGGVVISDRPVRVSWGGISCDRPEDFGLASRCMAFPQTFPPHIKSNSYNNNLLIVHTKAHVMIR